MKKSFTFKHQLGISAILLLLLANTPLSYSMPNGRESEWFPEWLTLPQSIQLMDIILAEPASEIIPTDESPQIGFRGQISERDFGWGWGFVDDLRLECLKEVKRRSEQAKTRPRVLDLGAGLGHMGWKLIVAGADYTAIEGQGAAAKALQQKLLLSKKFLKSGEKLAQFARIKNSDVTKWIQRIAQDPTLKPEPFDVIFMGDFLHFLTPEQINLTLATLHSMINPGGEIFATADSPGIFSIAHSGWQKTNQVAQVFFQNRSRGLEFPGSIILNIESSGLMEYSASTTNVLNQTYSENQILGGFHSSNPNVLGLKIAPGESQLGWIGTQPTSLFESMTEKTTHQCGDSCTLVFKSTSKRAIHIFDNKTLRTVFEKNGFVSVDTFYTNNLGKRSSPEPESQSDFEHNFYKVAIRAKKSED